MSHTPRFTSFMTEIPFTTSTTNFTPSFSEITSKPTTPTKTPTLTWEQFVLLKAELDRLSTLCKTLTTENESLRCAQRNSLQQIDSLKISLAYSRESDNKYTLICQEKDRVNSILTERLREIDLLRVRIGELEGNGAKANNDLRQKLTLLVTDNQRLNSLVFDKQKEIEELKRRGHGWEDKDRILNEKLREIDLLRVKITQFEGNNNELKGKLTLLVSENERLNRVLAEKTDLLRARVVELEKGLGQLNELRAKISQLLTENERLSCIIVDKSKEIESLKLRRPHNNEFEGKYHLALQERDRLNSILGERLKEIDALRTRIIEIEKNFHQSDELRGKLALLASENDRINHLLNEKMITIREWESKYSTLEALYKKVKISVDSLEEVKRNLVQSIEHTERKEPSLRKSRSGEVVKKTSNYEISSGTNTNAGSPLKSRSPVMKSGFNISLNNSYYV